MAEKRKGANRIADIPPKILADINKGKIETSTLAEGLAVDFQKLLVAAIPEAKIHVKRLDPTLGIVRRMALAGEIIFEHFGPKGYDRFKGHPADTVRGWSAYALASDPKSTLAKRLKDIRPLADDPHSGVREWAWIALRPHVADEIAEAIKILTPWAAHKSPFVRRYAIEITRPRGVWCCHIDKLKKNPQIAFDMLSSLRSDPHKYVQDSVSNWLNDASKSQPSAVRSLCQEWLKSSPSKETQRICKRALRSIEST